MEQTVEQFFALLFENAPAGSYFYGARILKAVKRAYPKFYDNPDLLLADVKAHQENEQTDFYFSPAFYFRKTKAIKSNVRGAGSVWVDIDGGDFPEFEQEPNFVIETSPSHWHCYWLLEEMKRPDEIEAINRTLAYQHNLDKSGWDSTQLLRPPGSFNRRRSNFQAQITRYNPHSRADFSDVRVEDYKPVVQGGTDGTFVSVERLLAGLVLPQRVHALLFEATDTKSGEGRSGVIFNTACEFVRLGLKDEEIQALLEFQDLRLKKFENHADKKGILQGVIARARQKEKQPQPKEVILRPLYQIWKGNEQFFLDVTQDEYHCEHLVFEDGMIIIGGEPGSGKSRFALNLIDCLACGRDFLGKKVKRPIKCAYLGLDMPARRVRGIRQQQFNGFSPEEQALINQNVTLLIRGSGMNLIEPTIQERVTADFLESEAEFIVIDVLGRALPTLKDDEIAQPFLNWLQEYINDHSASFGLVTHTRKSQVGNKSAYKLDDWFGSRYWSITPDTGITIEDRGKSQPLILHVNKDRSGELEDEIHVNKDYTNSLYTVVTSEPKENNKKGTIAGTSGIPV